MTIAPIHFASIDEWYSAQCNGDWEHSYGIRIETTDNPGWFVEIELLETIWRDVSLQFTRTEVDASVWWQFEVTGGIFRGSGGVSNLANVLAAFLGIVNTCQATC